MNNFFTALGGLFAFLALFFLLGLLKPFARRFYPVESGVVRRAAAPVIFACLAIACFRGWGLMAMAGVVVGGIILMKINKRNRPKQKIRI